MAITRDIKSKALEILERYPQGIRYSELGRQIKKELPNASKGTINANIWNLDTKYPSQVLKPSRGLFVLSKYGVPTSGSGSISEKSNLVVTNPSFSEDDFYQPFADYLWGELNECTVAKVTGSTRYKMKWSNPDVTATRKPPKHAFVQYIPTEIIAAELKISTVDSDLITGFGQACAYRLFSHKTYLVVPSKESGTSFEMIDRLTALCRIFGVGLVTYDISNSEDPDFQVLMRAVKYEPDMIYVEDFFSNLEKSLDKKDFNELLY